MERFMKIRLLLIFLTGLLATAFSNAAGSFSPDDKDIASTITSTPSDYELKEYEDLPLIPRNSEFSSQLLNTSITKRPVNQRDTGRFVFFAAGRPLDRSFIERYKLIFDNFPSGLSKPENHFISLGKLII